MKKSIPIERLLTWAYTEELPKVQRDPTWATMFRTEAWALGCRVDHSSSGDCLPEVLGPPHEDAWRVHEAMKLIGAAKLNWTKDAEILLGHFVDYLDWNEVASRCEGMTKARMAGNRAAKVTYASELIDLHQVEVGPLLMHHAVSRTRPIWHLGEPTVEKVKNGNGHAKVHGTKLRNGAWSEGSACPLQLEPSAIQIAIARFEYYVWVCALRALAVVLRDLSLWDPEEPIWPMTPWTIDSYNLLIMQMKSDFSTNHKKVLAHGALLT